MAEGRRGKLKPSLSAKSAKGRQVVHLAGLGGDPELGAGPQLIFQLGVLFLGRRRWSLGFAQRRLCGMLARTVTTS